jgi:hypothetical protein
MNNIPDSQQDQTAVSSPEYAAPRVKNAKVVTARINRFKIFYFFLLLAIMSPIGALTFEFLARLPHLSLAFLNLELFVVFIIMQLIAIGAWWFRRPRIDKKLQDAIGRTDGRGIFRLLLRREFSNLSASYAAIMFFMGGFLVLTWNGLEQDVRATALPTSSAASTSATSRLCGATAGLLPQMAGPAVEGDN